MAGVLYTILLFSKKFLHSVNVRSASIKLVIKHRELPFPVRLTIHTSPINFTEYHVTVVVKVTRRDFAQWLWNIPYYFSILLHCDCERIVIVWDLLLEWEQLPCNWRPAPIVLMVSAYKQPKWRACTCSCHSQTCTLYLSADTFVYVQVMYKNLAMLK